MGGMRGDVPHTVVCAHIGLLPTQADIRPGFDQQTIARLDLSVWNYPLEKRALYRGTGCVSQGISGRVSSGFGPCCAMCRPMTNGPEGETARAMFRLWRLFQTN